MSYAREIVAMRTLILAGLTPAEIRAVNMQAVADAAAPAIERGWSGDEDARVALDGLDRAQSIGAVMVTNVRRLANKDPPRTPQPPPVAQVLAEQHTRHTPATNPGQWLKRIRGEAS